MGSDGGGNAGVQHQVEETFFQSQERPVRVGAQCLSCKANTCWGSLHLFITQYIHKPGMTLGVQRCDTHPGLRRKVGGRPGSEKGDVILREI